MPGVNGARYSRKWAKFYLDTMGNVFFHLQLSFIALNSKQDSDSTLIWFSECTKARSVEWISCLSFAALL